MNDVDQIISSIRKQLEAVPDYGQIQLHLKRHRGEFHNTDVVKITSTKFDQHDPNVMATTMMFQLVKSIADAAETGTLSFSLNFKNGQAEQMTVQDFRKL